MREKRVVRTNKSKIQDQVLYAVQEEATWTAAGPYRLEENSLRKEHVCLLGSPAYSMVEGKGASPWADILIAEY